MSQSIDLLIFKMLRSDFSPDTAAQTVRRCGGLFAGLGLMAVVDVGLVLQLAKAIGTVMTDREAPLAPMLAATGCAMTAGAALALTWLVFEDLAQCKRDIFPSAGTKSKSGDFVI